MTIRGLYANSASLTPRDLVPGRGANAALRCGVGEIVDLNFESPFITVGTWTITSGGGTLVQGAGGKAVYTCPDVPGGQTTSRVVLSFGGNKAEIELDIVAPTTGDLVKLTNIHKFSNVDANLNYPNSGFFGRHVLAPVDVSFKGILLREGLGHAQTSGVFDGLPNPDHTWTEHWIPPGGGTVTDKGTIFGWDEVFSGSRPYVCDPNDHGSVGTLDWGIDWHYMLPPGSDADHGRRFDTVRHKAWAYRDGRICVTKGTPYHWSKLDDPMLYSHPLNHGLDLRGQWIVV